MSGRVLLVVENETVPADRRVWWEACTLRDHGWDVRIVAPRSGGLPAHETIEGIGIRRCRWPDEPRFGAHVVEYGAAMAVLGAALLAEWRADRFDVLHVASPPDMVALLGRPFQRKGARVIFDHHDLSPELWVAKGGTDGGRVHKALLAVERRVVEMADRVISANATYRATVLERVSVDPARVAVVMNGVELDRYRNPLVVRERPPWKTAIGYVGSMGSQDGLDSVVEVVADLVGRGHDVGAVLAGDGPVREACMALGDRLGVADRLQWLGSIPHGDVAGFLASVDIGISPDPPNPFNHQSTMIKTLEYLAAGLPIVAYDLTETRRICGGAAVYASGGTPDRLADAVEIVIDQPELRTDLVAEAHARAPQHDRSAWVQPLLEAYDFSS